MNLVLAINRAVSSQVVIKMNSKMRKWMQYSQFFIWPLIVAGGRLVTRVILNIWDMLEV